MKTRAFLKLIGAIASAACFSAPAQATPITGIIQFVGDVVFMESYMCLFVILFLTVRSFFRVARFDRLVLLAWKNEQTASNNVNRS
jgi:hypothetical protein